MAVRKPVPARAASRTPGARRKRAYRQAYDVADLLPADWYVPARRRARGGAPQRPAARVTRKQRTVRPLRHHRLPALAALAMAVGASFVLPAAGTLTVAALITLLRAAHHARRGLAARRRARGRRPADPLVLVASMPWQLGKSVIETILIAAPLLAVAGIAAATATTAIHWSHMPPAGDAAAAAYTVLSCVGPWSKGVRRELNRAFNAVAATPLTAAMAMLTLGALAIAVLSLLLIRTPALWPLPQLQTIHLHLPGVDPAHPLFRG